VCDFPAASAAASSFGSNGTHRRGNTVRTFFVFKNELCRGRFFLSSLLLKTKFISFEVSSHDEVVTIQLLSGSDVNEARPALQQDSFECSWRGMCGPK